MAVRKVRQAFAFDFEVELARVLRRAELLRAALRGDALIEEVRVRETKVRAHTRREHVRYVLRRRKR